MIEKFLQALKGLCDVRIYMPISILSNLFAPRTNNYYVNDGGTLIQVSIPDEKCAEVFGKALRGESTKEPVKIETENEPQESP